MLRRRNHGYEAIIRWDPETEPEIYVNQTELRAWIIQEAPEVRVKYDVKGR